MYCDYIPDLKHLIVFVGMMSYSLLLSIAISGLISNADEFTCIKDRQ